MPEEGTFVQGFIIVKLWRLVRVFDLKPGHELLSFSRGQTPVTNQVELVASMMAELVTSHPQEPRQNCNLGRRQGNAVAHGGYYTGGVAIRMPTVGCPDCGSDMSLIAGRFGGFYGCSRYPACRGSHAANSLGEPAGTPADANTRRMRAAVIKVVKAGYLDPAFLLKPISELTAAECAAALSNVDQFPEPFTREEQTLWDHLVSEAEAED